MKRCLTVLISLLFIAVNAGAQQGDWYNDDGGFSFTGFGTENNPFEISSEAALSYLAEQVNKSLGESYEGMFFILTKDLDLADHYWNPIANSAVQPFKGIFNGNGKTIYNLHVRNSDSQSFPASGLFGYVGNGAKIENLTIESGRVEGCNSQTITRTGALAGYLLCNVTGGEDSIIIRNCHNKNVTVTGGNTSYSNTGGLIGEAYAFSDSDGAVSILIENCTNTGAVVASPSNFPYTGGIIGKGRGHGYCDGSISAHGSFAIVKCENSGVVSGGNTTGVDAVSSTGGILGFGYASGDGYGDSDGAGVFTVNQCVNTGLIRGGDATSDNAYTYTGGIFGYGDGYGYGDTSSNTESKPEGHGYGSGMFTITSSINRGGVNGGDAINSETISATGGVFGFASGSGAGDRQGHGYAYGSFSMRNCYSFADISTRKGCIGGLGGWIATSGNGPNYVISAIMQDSYVAGTINKNVALSDVITGGIIGRVHRSDNANKDPHVDRCLVALSFIIGSSSRTFRIAGQLLNVESPAKTLTRNYAYIRDGKWIDTASVQNGEEWTGIMTEPPISEWNSAGNAWIIIKDTYEFMPKLRYIPNQQNVLIP